jgi:tetratricopeptide (TPR) repeat protein
VTRSGTFRILLCLLLLSFSAGAQEAERQAMLEKAGPSVVAIRNNESYGSGIVLDDQGTILTSAHVIVSPLPLRVEAQIKENGQLRTLHFQKVVLIGVHPSRDLALIRIDPSDNKVKFAPLPIAKNRVTTRDLIHAIGFPSSHGGNQKICTTGEVTGVDRFVDMPGYFEISAEVHPGNSGGPIVDTFGNAVGVLTAGHVNGERIAYAIPLCDLRPDQFVPLDRRPKDPAKASKLLRIAEEQLKKARGGRLVSGLVSMEIFQMAMLEDISNPDIYYKIGMILRAFGEFTSATAYLMRSIQLEPWSESKDQAYHELGIVLANLKKPSEAVTVWTEGIAKFPGESGRIWDDLAIYHYDAARFYEAACASRASLRAFGSRAEAMNSIYDQSRRRLAPDALAKLAAYEQSLDGEVRAARKTSEQARREGKRYLSPACDTLIRSYEGVQREASNFNFSSLGKGPNAPKPVDIPEADLIPLFIQCRIAAAGEHLQAGRIELAAGMLEDVVKTYPGNPETEAARDLLALIKKSRKK